MRNITITTLTKEKMEEVSPILIAYERYMENIGGPNWGYEHFMKELPRKWELSFLMTQPLQEIIGYAIVSERDSRYHVHRPFLLPQYRFSHTRFLTKTLLHRAKESGLAEMSWITADKITGCEALQRFADKQQYLGNWDNANFFYMSKRLNPAS